MTSVESQPRPVIETDGRREILNAATELFAEKGYSRVSIRELAARAGCSTANLYHHFSSKYEIFVTLVERTMDDHHAGVRNALEQDDEPVDQLAAVLRNHLLVHMTRAGVRLVLDGGFHPLAGSELEHFIAERDRYERAVREIVVRGVDAGVLDVDDPALAVRAAMGACSAVQNWFRPDGPLSAEDVADRITSFLLAGFGARAEATASLDREGTA